MKEPHWLVQNILVVLTAAFPVFLISDKSYNAQQSTENTEDSTTEPPSKYEAFSTKRPEVNSLSTHIKNAATYRAYRVNTKAKPLLEYTSSLLPDVIPSVPTHPNAISIDKKLSNDKPNAVRLMTKEYAVQVFAGRNYRSAYGIVKSLQKDGYSPYIVEEINQGNVLFKVRLGRSHNYKKTKDLKNLMQRRYPRTMTDSFVVRQQ